MSASRSVVSSAKLIAVCTLISRITGLARDILLAQAFGIGWVQDAFSYAFQVPNLFRRLFGEGAMAPVFVPTFTRTLENEGRPAAWRLLARTLALMTVALAGMIVVLWVIIAAVWWLAPVDPEKAAPRALLLSLTAVMLPFMLTVCLLALLSAILNCVGSFVPAALTPIVLNLLMIGGIAWAAPRLYPGQIQAQVYVVAWSVLVAGVLQLVVIVPALRANGITLGFRLDLADPTVRHMLRLLVPVALGQGVLAFGVFLDAQLCTMLSHVRGTADSFTLFGWSVRYPLQEGALSAITYAQRLYQFPLGVLVISLATAALPAFVRHATRKDWPAWTAEVRQSLRLAVFEGLLAGVMMILLPQAMIRLLFERGHFTAADTPRVSFVVACYGFGLWAFCAQHIVLRAFYSLEDVRTPLAISAALLPLNVALNVALIWCEGVREAAFAISSCTTATLSVVLGLVILRRRVGVPLLDRTTWLGIGKMVAATGLTAFVLAAVQPAVAPWLSRIPGKLLPRAVETLGLLGLGAGTFLIAAWLLRLQEVRLLLTRRKRK
jgi:putative peptidoglycan lipid II flippase